MPVNNNSVHSESFEPIFIDLEVMSVHGVAGLTDSIDINKDCKVVQLVVTGKCCSLPYTPFSYLAVTADAINPVVDLVEILA